jgi:hypothetical protein
MDKLRLMLFQRLLIQQDQWLGTIGGRITLAEMEE